MKLEQIQIGSYYGTSAKGKTRRGVVLAKGVELGGRQDGVQIRWDRPAALAGQTEVVSSRQIAWCCDRQMAEEAQDELRRVQADRQAQSSRNDAKVLIREIAHRGIAAQAQILRAEEDQIICQIHLTPEALRGLMSALGLEAQDAAPAEDALAQLLG